MKTLDVEWLERAVEAIKGGLADKLERERERKRNRLQVRKDYSR